MAVASIDLCIVGAGAAGLAAGIFAAERNPHLTIELLDGARSWCPAEAGAMSPMMW